MRSKRIIWEAEAELEADHRGRCAGRYEYSVSLRRWRYLGVGHERLAYTPRGGQQRLLIDRVGRKLIEFAGALYHVTSRGNGRDAIYLQDEDQELKSRKREKACFISLSF